MAAIVMEVESYKKLKNEYMFYKSTFYHTRRWERIKAMFIVSGVSFVAGALLMLQLVANAMGI